MKYKGITISDKEAVKIFENWINHDVNPIITLENYKTDSEKLQDIAKRITKAPQKVRRYT